MYPLPSGLSGGLMEPNGGKNHTHQTTNITRKANKATRPFHRIRQKGIVERPSANQTHVQQEHDRPDGPRVVDGPNQVPQEVVRDLVKLDKGERYRDRNEKTSRPVEVVEDGEGEKAEEHGAGISDGEGLAGVPVT